MKSIYLKIGLVLLAFNLISCTDNLNKPVLDQFDDNTFWTSEASARAFAQGFYLTASNVSNGNYFQGYNADFVAFGGFFTGDRMNEDLIQRSIDQFPKNTDESASQASWSFLDVRRANHMMMRVSQMNLADADKNHWLGVARFFRAMRYSQLVKAYGDVPFYNKTYDPTDETELFKPRDPRTVVVDSIMADFKFAVENIRADDGDLQVNKYVAAAFMSRVMLYQATWMKYHGTTVGPQSQAVSNEKLKTYFEAAVWAAQQVMNSGKYAIGNTYNALFSSESLAKNPEIIFYREYDAGILTNALMSYNNLEDQVAGATKNLIETYLCDDGLPISQSSEYKGVTNPTVENVFENRDPRLYDTFVDSLRTPLDVGASPSGYSCKKFLNEDWRESKSPLAQNNKSSADAPIMRYAEVLLNYVEASYELSTIGGPAFTQDMLDKSINQIRKRVLTRYGTNTSKSMPALELSGSNAAVSANGVLTVINDPQRDPDVSPILWEIRRERRIELVLEGFGSDDLNRWAKFDKLNTVDNTEPTDANLGAWFVKSNFTAAELAILLGGSTPPITLYYPNPSDQSEGYIWTGPVATLQRTFVKGDLNSERMYLNALPQTEITFYQSKGYTLAQNPGW